jgi:GNAT superfamily N-acetyltransferase
VPIEIRMLAPADAALLEGVGPNVFDAPVDAGRIREFLGDPRHHIAAAIDDGRLVGFASAVHYVHPDKAPQLWINEVSVAETHRRRGLARSILKRLLDHGRALGCEEAWVLTHRTNVAAMALYAAVGGEAEDCVMFNLRLRG